AALSAGDLQVRSLLQNVLAKYRSSAGYEALVQKLAAMVGSGSDEGQIHSLIHRALTAAGKPLDWQAGLLTGLAEGLRRNEARKTILAQEQAGLISTYFTH